MPAMRLARAIASEDPARLRPEERLVGHVMLGMLQQARPLVCPSEQLNAISDDIFRDLGEAVEYASQARLPFDVVYFDFIDELGRAPAIGFHVVEGGGRDLGFELRGVLAGENADERETVFLPIIGHEGQPPEEVGAVFVDWDGQRRASAKPGRWQEAFRPPGRSELDVTFISVSAAMQALGETPRAVGGTLMGVARFGHPGSEAELLTFKAQLATLSGTATRLALKVLYLLDSVNVDLAPAKVSRQVRRQAERKGAEIAWVINVRAPHRRELNDETEPGSRAFSHRFEVRGNFAHHGEGSWLYEHSDPADIRPCPRCGRCRRVWRQPHIKGPVDKPLLVKIRRVDFDDPVG
jgi:hypothetical protein